MVRVTDSEFVWGKEPWTGRPEVWAWSHLLRQSPACWSLAFSMQWLNGKQGFAGLGKEVQVKPRVY